MIRKYNARKKIGVALLLLFLAVMMAGCAKKKAVFTRAELISALPVSELSSVECVRNGIAEIERGQENYHIRYEAKVKLGADFQKIDIQIDEKKKTVVFTAPEVSVLDIIIDPSSLSFIPSNSTQIEIDEILEACENDVAEEIEYDNTLFATAQDNFMSIVEGFLRPLISDSDYSFSWFIERIEIVREYKQWTE